MLGGRCDVAVERMRGKIMCARNSNQHQRETQPRAGQLPGASDRSNCGVCSDNLVVWLRKDALFFLLSGSGFEAQLEPSIRNSLALERKFKIAVGMTLTKLGGCLGRQW